jgi:hypothetical protein
MLAALLAWGCALAGPPPCGVTDPAPPHSLLDLLQARPAFDVVETGRHTLVAGVRDLRSFGRPSLDVRLDGRDAAPRLYVFSPWPALLLAEPAEATLWPPPAPLGPGRVPVAAVLDLRTRPGGGPSPAGSLALEVSQPRGTRAHLGAAWDVGGAGRLSLSGGLLREATFSQPRTTRGEYFGAPREAAAPSGDPARSTLLALRYRAEPAGAELSLGAGAATAAGIVDPWHGGRQETTDLEAPWADLALEIARRRLRTRLGARWSRLASRNQLSLASGERLWLTADAYALELATEAAAGRWQLRAGGALRGDHADSADPRGRQTLLGEAEREASSSGFVEADLEGAAWRARLGARWDRGPGVSGRLSPRVALAWSPGRRDTLEVAYGEGLRPAPADRRLARRALSQPLDLGALDAAYGLDLGFRRVRVLELGNAALAPERLRAEELAYLRRRPRGLDLEVSAFRHRSDDLPGELRPGVHPEFLSYRVPEGVPADTAELFLATLPLFLPAPLLAALTNAEDGSPLLAYSYRSEGGARLRGADLRLGVPLPLGCRAALAYRLRDFEPLRAGAALLANLPDHAFSGALGCERRRWAASAAYRWQAEHEWSSGIFRGTVPELRLLDLGTRFRARRGAWVSLEVRNALDVARHQAFGGDLVGRRAAARITLSW